MTPIDDMPAGSELDALVAEKVMGWHRVPEWGLQTMGKPSLNGTLYTSEPVPDYSTDIAAAWEVLNKLQPVHIQLIHWADSDSWQCIIGDGPMTRDYEMLQEAWCDTAPLAICRAALQAFKEKP